MNFRSFEDFLGACIFASIATIVILSPVLIKFTCDELKNSKSNKAIPVSFVAGTLCIGASVGLALSTLSVISTPLFNGTKMDTGLNAGLQILCGVSATAFAIEGILLLLLGLYKIHERSKNKEVTQECTEIMLSNVDKNNMQKEP